MSIATYGVRQKPPGASRTFATFEARIGYALPDERQLQLRMANGQPSPHIVRLEMSINEPICDSTTFTPGPGFAPLRISTLDDIAAEKLRALLQQPIRNRHRRQDLLDLAVTVRANPALDRHRIAAFLTTKAAARDVPVSRAAFHDAGIAARASIGYAELEATTRTTFVPFDEALATVLAFVDELPIPD